MTSDATVTTEAVAFDLSAPARGSALRRAGLGFAAGVAALVVGSLAFLLGLAVAYDGRALPGVRVGRVDVAGLDRASAEARLRASLPLLGAGKLTLTLDGQSRTISYEAVGRDYDMAALLDATFAVGRTGSPLERAADEARSLLRGSEVKPIARYDEATVTRALAAAAGELQHPARNATVQLLKDGRFSIAPAATGLAVDGAAGLAAIDAALAATSPADSTVQLSTTVAQPEVTTQEALDAALQGTLLSNTAVPLEAGGKTYTIPASSVRGWLTFQPQADGTLAAVFDAGRVEATLRTLATRIDRPASNAGFTTNATRVTGVVPSQEGLSLDARTSAVRLAAALQAHGPGTPLGDLTLAVTTVQPHLTTAAAKAMAPRMHVISQWTTRYIPSDHNFFGANIKIPASQINGLVLAPGDWFDFWKVVRVSRDLGFGPGGAIINGHTEPTGALGGGICSCSTTLFNAALRAGLQIGIRANHYYYIDRYPVGLDATVFKSDGGYTQTMSFRNDTRYPILIKGINTPGHVTFQLFSVDLGRRVSFSTPIVKNYRAASDSVQYTSSLAPGVRQRVEYPVAGFDAWVTRTVTDLKTGKVLHKETYYSHYARITGLLLIGGSRPAPTPAPSPSPSP